MTTQALYPGPTLADLACIPDVLKALRQWVLWRGVDRLGAQGAVSGLDKGY